MSIFFHPTLFDDRRFAESSLESQLDRVVDAIVPGQHFDWDIEGYDIISYRIAESPYRPIGSIVDAISEAITNATTAMPQRTQILAWLGKLTERHGNLDASLRPFLGFLTAAEVVSLKQALECWAVPDSHAAAEHAALIKILSVAECAHVGLLYSIG